MMPWRQQRHYDVRGNVVRVEELTAGDGAAFETLYSRNVLGETAVLTYPKPVGHDPDLVVTYGYNPLGLVESIGAPADPQRWAALEYGADGQITSETLNPQQTLISKGPTPVRQTFRYNSPGLPIAIRASIIEDGVASDCFSETLSYWDEAGADGKTYYYNGQIAGIVHSFGQDEKRAGLQDYGWRFLYDPKGEVQVAENSKFPEYSLGSPSSPVLYDANGNILRLPHGKQVDEFKYFAGTNKLKNTDGSASQSLAYTESGRTKRIDAPPPGTELKYDQVDGLTRAAVDAFGETTFEYGEGDRRAKVLAPDGVARKYYFGVEGRPLAEEYKNETVRFIAGAGRLLAVVGGKTTGYIVADHEMSSRLVLDDHGRLLGGYNYLPFGGQMGKSVGSNPELLRYLYTGQEWDASRGLYNMNARWYDPRTRRFLTPDPQQQFPSPYIYAANDPILFIDPTGEALWDAILSSHRVQHCFRTEPCGRSGRERRYAGLGVQHNWCGPDRRRNWRLRGCCRRQRTARVGERPRSG